MTDPAPEITVPLTTSLVVGAGSHTAHHNKINWLLNELETDAVTTDTVESVIASVDSNAASNFRIQQDARVAAAYGTPRQVKSAILANGTDQTAVLQAEINALGTDGGTILIPEGVYKFTGSITLPARAGLRGAKIPGAGPQSYAAPWYGTHLSHQPTTPAPFISTPVAVLAYNIALQDLKIMGNANSTIGLGLYESSFGKFTDIFVTGFDDNIVCTQLFVTRFDGVRSTEARVSCLHIKGPLISTSTTFNDCYIGQTRYVGAGAATARPIVIDKDIALGITFNNVVTESTFKPMSLGSGNVLTFNALYTENIPADTAAAEAVIEIGKTGAPAVANNGGNYHFAGGYLSGSNGGVHASSSIFDIDYALAVTVSGARLARAADAIKRTANSKAITAIGTTDVQVTRGVGDNPEVRTVGNYSGSYAAPIADNLVAVTGTITPGANYTLWGSGSAPKVSKSAGLVVCQGRLPRSSGNLSSVDLVCTLPVGFRPTGEAFFTVVASGDTRIELLVLSDGTVSIVTGSPSTWVSLAGIVFAAA